MALKKIWTPIILEIAYDNVAITDFEKSYGKNLKYNELDNNNAKN